MSFARRWPFFGRKDSWCPLSRIVLGVEEGMTCIFMVKQIENCSYFS